MIAARLSPGAISESNSSHFPPSEASEAAKPVVFPPGWLSRGTMPLRAILDKYQYLLEKLNYGKSSSPHTSPRKSANLT
jgi:hypothetical protein